MMGASAPAEPRASRLELARRFADQMRDPSFRERFRTTPEGEYSVVIATWDDRMEDAFGNLRAAITYPAHLVLPSGDDDFLRIPIDGMPLSQSESEFEGSHWIYDPNESLKDFVMEVIREGSVCLHTTTTGLPAQNPTIDASDEAGDDEQMTFRLIWNPAA